MIGILIVFLGFSVLIVSSFVYHSWWVGEVNRRAALKQETVIEPTCPTRPDSQLNFYLKPLLRFANGAESASVIGESSDQTIWQVIETGLGGFALVYSMDPLRLTFVPFNTTDGLLFVWLNPTTAPIVPDVGFKDPNNSSPLPDIVFEQPAGSQTPFYFDIPKEFCTNSEYKLYMIAAS